MFFYCFQMLVNSTQLDNNSFNLNSYVFEFCQEIKFEFQV